MISFFGPFDQCWEQRFDFFWTLYWLNFNRNRWANYGECIEDFKDKVQLVQKWFNSQSRFSSMPHCTRAPGPQNLRALKNHPKYFNSNFPTITFIKFNIFKYSILSSYYLSSINLNEITFFHFFFFVIQNFPIFRYYYKW